MRKILLTVIVLALAIAPIAFGHGVVGHASQSSHNHHHTSAEGPMKDGDGIGLVESEAAACCGPFAGHCSSGLYFTDTASLKCPDFHSVIRLATYDQGHRGVDPEAETPPPRV
jgi:hypothetical protein